MKRIANIAAGASAILCGLFLVMFAVSHRLTMSHHDLPSRRWISPHSIAIDSHFRAGFEDGFAWFFSREVPYRGSIVRMGSDSYKGGVPQVVQERKWVLGNFGFNQMRFVGGQGEFMSRHRGADLPGIYYRHFEWWKEEPWWTLRVSLWYPIAIFGILPLVWMFRRREYLLREVKARWRRLQACGKVV